MITALASQAGATPPDSLRRAIAEVFARPEYRWADSRVVLRWLGTRWLAFMDWLNALQRSHPTQYAVLLGVAVVMLVAILVHFGYIVVRIVRPTLSMGPRPASPGRPVDDVGTHLSRAAGLAVAGRYAEALSHRFLALLLQLDARRAVHFHASKTPAEYVGEARVDAEGQADLSALVSRLYRHLFAAVPCDARGYEEFGMLAERIGEHVAH